MRGAGGSGGAGLGVAELEGERKDALLCPEPLCPHSAPNAPTWSPGLDSGRLHQPQLPGTLVTFLSETSSARLRVCVSIQMSRGCWAYSLARSQVLTL